MQYQLLHQVPHERVRQLHIVPTANMPDKHCCLHLKCVLEEECQPTPSLACNTDGCAAEMWR